MAVSDSLKGFGWDLEELRVSLFAQELKAPKPVSVKRLQKEWESLVKWIFRQPELKFLTIIPQDKKEINFMDKKEILLLNISRFDHYIELANNKASWLISVLLTLLFGVITFMDYTDIVKNLMKLNHIISCIFSLLCLVLIFFNTQAFYFLTKILQPNLKSNFSGNSILFFGDVFKNGFTELFKQIETFDDKAILKDMTEQVFLLAEIASLKYENVSKVNSILIYKIIPISLSICISSLIFKFILG